MGRPARLFCLCHGGPCRTVPFRVISCLILNIQAAWLPPPPLRRQSYNMILCLALRRFFPTIQPKFPLITSFSHSSLQPLDGPEQALSLGGIRTPCRLLLCALLSLLLIWASWAYLPLPLCSSLRVSPCRSLRVSAPFLFLLPTCSMVSCFPCNCSHATGLKDSRIFPLITPTPFSWSVHCLRGIEVIHSRIASHTKREGERDGKMRARWSLFLLHAPSSKWGFAPRAALEIGTHPAKRSQALASAAS